MKKLLSVLLAIVLVMAVFVPAASARGGGFSGGGGGWHGGGGWRGGGWHGGGWGWRGGGWGGGCWGCGFGWGDFTGAVLGSALAWPFYYPAYPYSNYAPYPYYGAPPAYYGAPPAYGGPQSSCYTQQGYWQQAPVSDGGGFTTYQNVWVPPQTVCR